MFRNKSRPALSQGSASAGGAGWGRKGAGSWRGGPGTGRPSRGTQCHGLALLPRGHTRSRPQNAAPHDFSRLPMEMVSSPCFSHWRSAPLRALCVSGCTEHHIPPRQQEKSQNSSSGVAWSNPRSAGAQVYPTSPSHSIGVTLPWVWPLSPELQSGERASAGGLRGAPRSQLHLPARGSDGYWHSQGLGARVRPSRQQLRALCCCSEPQMCWTAAHRAHLALQLHLCLSPASLMLQGWARGPGALRKPRG